MTNICCNEIRVTAISIGRGKTLNYELFHLNQLALGVQCRQVLWDSWNPSLLRVWSNEKKKDWLRTSSQSDKEVPTPESQIPELSCILLQVSSVPFLTLGFRTEKLYNLIQKKLMGDYQSVRPGVVRPGLTISSHKHGFKEKIWLLLLFRDPRQKQLVLPG